MDTDMEVTDMEVMDILHQPSSKSSKKNHHMDTQAVAAADGMLVTHQAAQLDGLAATHQVDHPDQLDGTVGIKF